MTTPRHARSELLSIGSELLVGETIDTNAAFLGAELAALGLPLSSVRMLPDDRGVLRDAFADAIARSPLVVATGGLGPTHDDLTREGLADALGEELREDPDLLAVLEQRFRPYGPMPVVNRRQATLVPSASALPNPIGSAPGWWVQRPEVVVVTLPGVPSEMRRMWAEQVVPRVRRRFDAQPVAARTVKVFGLGESAVAERLRHVLESPPSGVEAGIYARDDGVHVRFSLRGEAARALDECVAAALAALGNDSYGIDNATLPAVAMRRLGELGAATVASREWGTSGALLGILADATPVDGPRFVGGLLELDRGPTVPIADAVLEVALLPQDAQGRSRVRVSLSGAVTMPATELRIHGSGPQRLRRAAFAALDAVRRL